MKISEILNATDEELLRIKMTKEYQRADVHTSNWKSEVENVGRDYLLPKPDQDKVKVRVIEGLIRKRKSVLLSDELQITNVPLNGALGQDLAENADNVLKANYISMDMKGMYEDVIVDDALQGVGVLAVDGWNDYSQEPIISYVDSRLCFPDPDNWRGNQMKFFGTLLQKSIFELESDNAYDDERVEEVRLTRSTELQKVARANNDIKGFTDTDVGDELVDCYNHITIFKSSKDDEHCLYLTTWGADMVTLIRVVKMRALTENEKADPSKITVGIHLFRAHPIKGSFAGASLVDDSGQYQALKTLMTNLLIQQAIEAGLGGKTFVDASLGIDTNQLATIKGPAVITYKSKDPSKNAANSIINETPRPNNPAVTNGIATIDRLNEEATDMSSLVSGQSLSGTQTKAEIQTLSQNINQSVALMADSYLNTLIGFWKDVIRSYATNMSSQRVKEIIIVGDNGTPRQFGYRKNEFISKGEAYIVMTSKAQEAIKKSKDFLKLQVVYGTIRPLLKNESIQANRLDRAYIDTADIRRLNGNDLISYSVDEEIAISNLTLLNLDIELETTPLPGEDHNTYIQIYKEGIPTKARDNAIQARQEAKIATPKQPEAPQETDGTAKNISASLLAGQQAQDDGVSSLADAQV